MRFAHLPFLFSLLSSGLFFLGTERFRGVEAGRLLVSSHPKSWTLIPFLRLAPLLGLVRSVVRP